MFDTSEFQTSKTITSGMMLDKNLGHSLYLNFPTYYVRKILLESGSQWVVSQRPCLENRAQSILLAS